MQKMHKILITLIIINNILSIDIHKMIHENRLKICAFSFFILHMSKICVFSYTQYANFLVFSMQIFQLNLHGIISFGQFLPLI